MTHTLHRQGSPESLRGDYVILAMAAQGINRQGAAAKLARFSEIVLKHKPVNYGDMKSGTIMAKSADQIVSRLQDNSIVHGVFEDPAVVGEVLEELRQADLGVSVVVSGLFDEVSQCCRRAGLAPHTFNFSLGVWGKTERLPAPSVLEVSTMCGHGLVPFNLIIAGVEDIRAGRCSPEDVAADLARRCECGVFNHARALKLLWAMGKERLEASGGLVS